MDITEKNLVTYTESSKLENSLQQCCLLTVGWPFTHMWKNTCMTTSFKVVPYTSGKI